MFTYDRMKEQAGGGGVWRTERWGKDKTGGQGAGPDHLHYQ